MFVVAMVVANPKLTLHALDGSLTSGDAVQKSSPGVSRKVFRSMTGPGSV
jgi:hypothetical protein